MNAFLTDWISSDAVAASWRFTTDAFTPLLDWMLPKAKRSKHMFTAISMDAFDDVYVNGLHSERGTIGWAVDGGSITRTPFEPKPIKFTVSATAKDLTDMEFVEGQDAKAKYISRWTQNLRGRTELTMEAMLSSFLLGAGTMTIQKNTNSGVVDETFVYGSIPTVTNTVDWDNAAALATDAVETFRKMEQKLIDKGYGGDFIIKAGNDAWNALAKLVEGYTSTASKNIGGSTSMKVLPGRIEMFGYVVESINQTKTLYSAKAAKSTTPLIDADLIYGMATNNKNVMKFCKLDRFDGKAKETVAISTTVISESQLDITSDSKPFPLFDTDSFVISDVMA